MASVPLMDIEAAVVEARRAIEELGLEGVMLRANPYRGGVAAPARRALRVHIPHFMLGLKMEPSAYFKRQCRIATEGEAADMADVLRFIGDDRVIWASDDPHFDYKLPGALDWRKQSDLPDQSSKTWCGRMQPRCTASSGVTRYEVPCGRSRGRSMSTKVMSSSCTDAPRI